VWFVVVKRDIVRGLVVRSAVGCNPEGSFWGVMLIEVTCVGPEAVRELIGAMRVGT
jgi:hypothetical protein